MTNQIIKNEKFAKLMQQHIEDLLLYCFEAEQNFGILCEISHVDFNPKLPENIYNTFQNITLFFLAGYTFETAKIEDDMFIFEAGFGVDNIGSLVSVPILSILQIIIDEKPILINTSVYKKQQENVKQIDNSGIENSMSALLSNPENQKFKK